MIALEQDHDDRGSPPPLAGEVGPQSGPGGGMPSGQTTAVQWHVSSLQRSRARRLRRDLTDAERIVWDMVRAHRLNGFSFRRQTPIGPYIADFVCHAAHLVVEIDGGQHGEEAHTKRDAQRDTFLASKGFRVLRFSNHDVMTNRAGVLETVAAALSPTPSPTLPRRRGRGRNAEFAA